LATFCLSELPQDEKMTMPIPASRNLKGLSVNFTRAQLWLREKPRKIKRVRRQILSVPAREQFKITNGFSYGLKKNAMILLLKFFLLC